MPRYYEDHWVIRLSSKMSWWWRLEVLQIYSHSWMESTLLPIQNSMICPDLHLEFHLVAKQRLVVTALLLNIGFNVGELGLQLPNYRAQVLQLNVVPVLGVIQGVFQTTFLRGQTTTHQEAFSL